MKDDKPYRDESARFLKFKDKMNLTQADLARELDIKQPNLSAIEKGRRPFTFAQLRTLRVKYRLNINWYLTGQGTMLNEEEDKSTLLSDISTIKKDYDDLSKLYEDLRRTVTKLARDFYAKD